MLPTSLIHRRFESQAAARPDAVAIECAGIALTYRELNERANRLAHYLANCGVGADVPVGVCVERSPDLIVALLGVLKAGGAYLPLDPTYTGERLQFLLDDAQPAVILAQRRTATLLPECAAVVHRLDADWPRLIDFSNNNSNVAVTGANLAYLPYTSGSTGTSKGVAVLHRAVVRLLCGNDYVRFGPDEVFLHMAPLAFDASTFEIWGALLHGAKLVVMPPGTPNLSQIGEAVKSSRVTTLWLTAGLFHLMVQERLDDLGGLRQLLAGGDVLSVAHCRRVRERLPHVRLINGYGPTEATTFACCHTVIDLPADATTVPIGRPVGGTSVHVLDADGKPADEGELYIGGDGLARGYWNRPELTAELFVPAPFDPTARLFRTGDRVRRRADGVLEFLGRLDHQVKIRGYRVEPGEVEATILQHPGVLQTAVVAREDESGGKRLVAYVVPEIQGLREFVRDRLPEFMLPAQIVGLSELPLTSNGKIDKQRLTAGASPAARKVAPDEPPGLPRRSSTEQRLFAIWRALFPLGSPALSLVEAGGDSLTALKLVYAIEREFGRQLSVDVVMNSRGVEDLAEALDRGANAKPQALVPIQPCGSRVPLYLVHPLGGQVMGYRTLANYLGPDQPVFGLQAYPPHAADAPRTVEVMAARYVEEVRIHRSAGPYLLGGYSMGAFIAVEMARQLKAAGEPVGMVAVIDDGPALLRQRPAMTWTEVCGFVANLPRWLAFQFGTRAPTEIARDGLRKLRVWARRPAVDLAEVLDPQRFSPLIRPTLAAHYQAIKRYRVGTYDGPITLLRARVQPLFGSHAPELGWSAVAADGVTVHVIPGNHDAMLSEPFVKALAKRLGYALLRVNLSGLGNSCGLLGKVAARP